MGSSPEISVVIPVYRNRETLEELSRRLQTTLERHFSTWEVVFVDDACPDGCGELLRTSVCADPRFRIVDLPANRGQAQAVREGLAHARGQLIAVMDADLQDPPEAIPNLVAALESTGAWAVFAGRVGRYQSRGRMLWSRAFKGLLRVLVGLPANAGSYCLLARRAADTLLRHRVREPHLGTMVAALGLPLAVVPVPRQPRPRGRSAYSFAGRWRLAWRILATAVGLRWGKGGEAGNAACRPEEPAG